MKYGPQIGIIGHFFSAGATSLTLDAGSGAAGEIFRTDLDGDGTVGDLAPGTVPGDYMHRVKPNSLGSYINNFNSTYGGKFTPAGQALVNAGLFTPSQLIAANAVIQRIAALPTSTAIANPAFRTFDANVSYPIPLARFHEGLSLEPSIAMYNVANLANFGRASGVLANVNTAGGIYGTSLSSNVNAPNTFAVQNSFRTQRGSGTFAQGAPRTTEFQLKLNF